MGVKLTEDEKRALKEYHDRNSIYIAEVMDTRTPARNGDIKVWVLNSGTDRNNPENWVTAHQINNYGLTITDNKIGETYNTQPTGFGVWNTIPYIGNYVFIFYPCTVDKSFDAYWFGSANNYNNLMVPGISYDLTQKNDLSAKCETNLSTQSFGKRFEYTPLQNGLKTQGLDGDRLRGISTASTMRETPSHCYGFLSPFGNQMVIDDGWSIGDSNLNWDLDPRDNANDNNNKDDYGDYHNKKEWISSLKNKDKDNELNRFHGGFRFRTRNGTQILILDAGNIYMINKDGSAWMELSDDGYIDCYSEKGISASSDGDINLHGKNINIEAENTITLNAGNNMILNASGTISSNSGVLSVSDRLSVPTITASTGNINSLSSGEASIVGTFAGTLQGTAFYATSAGFMPMEQPLPSINAVELDSVEKPTYYNMEQKVDGETKTSITTRLPCHEPWAAHNKNNNIPDLVIKQVVKNINTKKVEPITKSNTI